jgi:REP element-mobilizing transposase RayT
MARPLRIEYPGAFYHVTSRGNERKAIFQSNRDREKFLEYLGSASERYGAVIHVYCLMDNHYHLLLETPEGNLAQIMRHINGAYTTYFNVKRKRSGHLFQGRYKAILVEADSYATELSRYIHLNPVRVGLVEPPEDYLWSSFRYYVGDSEAPIWLKMEFVLEYFGARESEARRMYRQFVLDAVGVELPCPLNEVVASTLLGSGKFIDEILQRYLDGNTSDRDLPARRELTTKPSLGRIVQVLPLIYLRMIDWRPRSASPSGIDIAARSLKLLVSGTV